MAKWGTTMAKLVHSAYNIFTQTSKHKSNMQSSRDFLSIENSVIHICVKALRFQRTNQWYSKQILHSIWTLMFRFICINKATWDLHSNDPGSHMHVQEKVSLTYYQYVDRMQMGVANPTIYDRCDWLLLAETGQTAVCFGCKGKVLPKSLTLHRDHQLTGFCIWLQNRAPRWRGAFICRPELA